MTQGRRSRSSAAIAGAVVVAFALAASCRTVAKPRPTALNPPAPALESLVEQPMIRVGVLADAARTSLAADSGVVVWPSAGPGTPTAVQRATFVPVLAAPLAARRFRVQVASLTDEAAARETGEQTRAVSGLVPSLHWNADTRTYQVRVGDSPSKDEAVALAERLGRAGIAGAWVAEEAPLPTVGRVRLLETGQEYGVVTVVQARSEEMLWVDGMSYRGVLEVRANESGTLTVVNAVNVEDYLRGVVPNELSPQAFPQLEALKAQAVAARTYALRNRGQFQAKGYDICATAACQVYRGRSTEDPLADEAIVATKGMAAVYKGGLINALYTSTCGGHTEDAANIFAGDVAAPYLRGVACTPERSTWGSIKTAAPPKSLGEEEGLNRSAALLVSLGVLTARSYSAAGLNGPATDGEIKAWTLRLLSALRRRGCETEVEPPLARRGALFQYLVQSLCWQERARRLLGPEDPDYLLQVEDRAELAGDGERLAAALLIQEGILSPSPDNALQPRAAITRAQAVGILGRTAAKVGPPDLLTAEFRGVEGGRLGVRRGDVEESYALDPGARLFRALDGTPAAASELTLAAGDRVRFVVQDGRVTFLEAEQSRLGASADRSSRHYRWEVRLRPAEVEKAIARYGNVGSVKDVVPRRIGVSGRVVELAVVGTSGELILTGLKIRWALGLRENLFVVDRETSPTGTVERFVFTGKGWGHGVGLCQVGAFGMAQAGSTYEQILRHYYSDISLQRVY